MAIELQSAMMASNLFSPTLNLEDCEEKIVLESPLFCQILLTGWELKGATLFF
jgi:hypothetical protein